MRRARERGHAAVWVLGVLGVSVGAGIATYVAIKDYRVAHPAPPDDDRATTVTAPPPERPVAPPPVEPVAADPPVPVPPEAPIDRAEADAVDPEAGQMFGTPGSDSGLDKNTVLVAIEAALPRLQKCQDAAKTGGTLRVRLVLNRRGGVTQATAKGDDDALGACAARALQDVRFGRTTDGAKLVIPIAFHAADQPVPCDEVACVLDNYESACCAKFKRPSSTGAPGTPESPTRSDIQRALATLRPQIAQCGADAGATGIIKVRFRVLPSGMVSEITVADAGRELGDCVLRAFRSYTFPATQNGVRASVPFSF